MRLHKLLGVSAVALFVMSGAGTAFADPKGLWLAEDGVKVRVAPCGAALCARVAVPNRRSIRRPAGPGPTDTIPIPASAVSRWSVSPSFIP